MWGVVGWCASAKGHNAPPAGTIAIPCWKWRIDRELTQLAYRKPRLRPTPSEGQRVPERPVGFAGVDEGEDVRVIEPLGDSDFVEEAFPAESGGEIRAEGLEGDLAIVPEVVRQVDGGHAALAPLALDCLAAGQGGMEPTEDLGQGDSPICLRTAWKRGC